MKKNKIIVAVILTFALLTATFAMSGGGNNDPAKEAQQIKQDTQNVQSGQSAQSDQIKSNDTVKDQYGVDTGMTKEEYEKFKEDYFSFQDQLGFYKAKSRFYHKINLNAKDKFATYEIDLNRTDDLCNINDFLLRSEIIVVASFEDLQIERNNQLTYPVTFNIRIHEVIHNQTEYSKIPEFIKVKGDNLYHYSFDDLEAGLNERFKNKSGELYLLFLSRYGFIEFKRAFDEKLISTFVDDTCFFPYTFTFLGNSVRKIKDNEIIFDANKNPMVYINLDQLKKNIKEINRINDIDNFYKRSYK